MNGPGLLARLLMLLALLVVVQGPVYGAVYDTREIWETTEVEVCFHDTEVTDFNELSRGAYKDEITAYRFTVAPLPAEIRSLITSSLQNEYTPEKTRVHFAGFKGCSQTPEAQIVVARAVPALNSRGFQGPTKKRVQNRNFVLLNLDFKPEFEPGEVPFALDGQDDLRLSIVHQFGHALGLLHENEYFEAAVDDPKCLGSETSDEARVFFKRQARENRVYSPKTVRVYEGLDPVTKRGYDTDSVMNPCQLKHSCAMTFDACRRNARSFRRSIERFCGFCIPSGEGRGTHGAREAARNLEPVAVVFNPLGGVHGENRPR